MDISRNNLKAIRKAAGMTQAELCKKAGVYNSMATGIEHNGLMPIQSNAERIAEALGVSVTDIWPDYRRFYSGYRPRPGCQAQIEALQSQLEALQDALREIAEADIREPEWMRRTALSVLALAALIPPREGEGEKKEAKA